MHQMSAAVQKFFEEFEQASNTFDGEHLASLFSDPFMAADPNGCIQVAKKDDLVAGTSKRRAFFQSVGFQFVKIVVLDETRLDDHYTMAKAHVHMRFEKYPGNPINVKNDSTYILFITDNASKIVFNLTHGDFMTIMQEHGLLPEKV